MGKLAERLREVMSPEYIDEQLRAVETQYALDPDPAKLWGALRRAAWIGAKTQRHADALKIGRDWIRLPMNYVVHHYLPLVIDPEGEDR